MIPIKAEIRVQSTTKATEGPAPFRRFRPKARTLLGFPSGTKSSSGSIIRQMPVKELLKVSISTLQIPWEGSFRITFPP